MESKSISDFKQFVIPSKGVFKKITRLQDSSKEPESGGDVNLHDFLGVSVYFSNGMTLTQLPGDDTVVLHKGGKAEEFKKASLDSDGKAVVIKNSTYKEIIYKNGVIEFEKDNIVNKGGSVFDKNHKKNRTKFYPSDRILYRVSSIEVLRNIDNTGKDLYQVGDLVMKPFVSLTELNTTYWPRK